MIHKEEVIILRSYDCKEYDRLYEIFSMQSGKRTIAAKGVRKPKAKLASGLEPITNSEIFLAKGRNFDKATGVIIRNQYPSIKKDLAKINSVKNFFNAIKKMLTDKSPENEINEKIYHLILFYLDQIENNSYQETKSLKIKLAILWKIIYWMGYQPGVFRCFNCSEKITEEESYSFFVPYGVSCKACLKTKKDIHAQEIKIDKNSLKMLRLFLKQSVNQTSKISLSIESLKRIERTVKLTLEQITEKRIDI